MFSFVNSITSTEMQTLIAPLFVQLAVSSVQQIFRCPGRGRFTAAQSP